MSHTAMFANAPGSSTPARAPGWRLPGSTLTGNEAQLLLHVERVVTHRAVGRDDPTEAVLLPAIGSRRESEQQLRVRAVDRVIASRLELRKLLLRHEQTVGKHIHRRRLEQAFSKKPGRRTGRRQLMGEPHLLDRLRQMSVERQIQAIGSLGGSSPQVGRDRAGGMGSDGGENTTLGKTRGLGDPDGGIELSLRVVVTRSRNVLQRRRYNAAQAYFEKRLGDLFAMVVVIPNPPHAVEEALVGSHTGKGANVRRGQSLLHPEEALQHHIARRGREAGGAPQETQGEMSMSIDEGRRDEPTAEVEQLGVAVLGQVRNRAAILWIEAAGRLDERATGADPASHYIPAALPVIEDDPIGEQKRHRCRQGH